MFAESFASTGVFDTASFLTNCADRTDPALAGVCNTLPINTLLVAGAGDSCTGFDTKPVCGPTKLSQFVAFGFAFAIEAGVCLTLSAQTTFVGFAITGFCASDRVALLVGADVISGTIPVCFAGKSGETLVVDTTGRRGGTSNRSTEVICTLSLHIAKASGCTRAGDTGVFDAGRVGRFCPVITHLIAAARVCGARAGGASTIGATFSGFAISGVAGRDTKAGGRLADEARFALCRETGIALATTTNADLFFCLCRVVVGCIGFFDTDEPRRHSRWHNRHRVCSVE